MTDDTTTQPEADAETVQPLIPPAAGEVWAAAVLKCVERLEDDPIHELDMLIANMPADKFFFSTFDQLFERWNLYGSANALKQFRDMLLHTVEHRIKREHEALQRLLAAMERRAAACIELGINAVDPVLRPQDLPGRREVCTELGNMIVCASTSDPSHPTADITPVHLSSGALVLVLGTNAEVLTYRASHIRRMTDSVRIHREREAAEREQQEAARVAREQEAKANTEEAREIARVQELRRRMRAEV